MVCGGWCSFLTSDATWGASSAAIWASEGRLMSINEPREQADSKQHARSRKAARRICIVPSVNTDGERRGILVSQQSFLERWLPAGWRGGLPPPLTWQARGLETAGPGPQ